MGQTENGIEGVGFELYIATHVVADGTDDVHVYPGILLADLVVERGEIGTRLDDQSPSVVSLHIGGYAQGRTQQAHHRHNGDDRYQFLVIHYTDRIF